MRRYWIEFDAGAVRLPIFTLRGVGVTAADKTRAIALIQHILFEGEPLPSIKKFVEDVDVSTLDENEVRPNMGNPAAPGIWFPAGFQ